MKIYKDDLDMIEANRELLLPLVMLEAVREIYDKYDGAITIETMWNIVSNGKKISPKMKRTISDLFNAYYNETGMEFSSGLYFKYDKPKSNFIIINFCDVVKIINDSKKVSDINSSLALVLNIHSYMDGEYIYKDRYELLQAANEFYPYNNTFTFDNPVTWFKCWPTSELEEFARFFIAYPTYEQISTKLHSNDINPLAHPYITNDGLNKAFKKLEAIGIICKVHTKYGLYSNKAVYCRVEHKEIAEALYNQIWENKQLAKKKAKEPKDEEDGG